jgi:hypothetical protein
MACRHSEVLESAPSSSAAAAAEELSKQSCTIAALVSRLNLVSESPTVSVSRSLSLFLLFKFDEISKRKMFPNSGPTLPFSFS